MVNWPLGLKIISQKKETTTMVDEATEMVSEVTEEQPVTEEQTVATVDETQTQETEAPVEESVATEAASSQDTVDIEVNPDVTATSGPVSEPTTEPSVEPTDTTTETTSEPEMAPAEEPEAPAAESEEETQPMPESNAADIVTTAATIHQQYETFETDFMKAETDQADLLKRILSLMAARNTMLTAMADSLEAENKLLAEFSVQKAG